ncbi:MAG: phosphoribosylaminoimidazolesuccinocarboxamide synthase [Rickettsiales bacterium]|jgi:phosphoribosylaminoimidazole-succinocarboxamide synthase|nr:phosphoribosylaminoimidazolesuccinocarboxamide synthase [Rickettsiales bacterium]
MAKAQITSQYSFLPLKLLNTGKVRETFEFDDQHLLIVTTDRISALDIVLETQIPGKGIVLNQMSNFWMENLVPDHNHLMDTNMERIAESKKELAPFISQLQNRAVLVKKLKMFPLECIVRGYFTGSVVKKYQKDNNGMVLGHDVGMGLTNWQKFPKGNIYTPSTKAELGLHDQNLTREQAKEILTERGLGEYARSIEELSLNLYGQACEYALSKNIILVDTKLEPGLDGEVISLGDEMFTPDSSRFIATDEYEKAFAEGRDPASLDKEPVRRVVRGMLKGLPEGTEPEQQTLKLCEDDVKKTIENYTDIYFNLVGEDYNHSATRALYAIRANHNIRSK